MKVKCVNLQGLGKFDGCTYISTTVSVAKVCYKSNQWSLCNQNLLRLHKWSNHLHKSDFKCNKLLKGNSNPSDHPSTPLEPKPAKEDVMDPPYFVSISRRSGFRRLHKNYCCGVMPWQCYKVEWVHEVKASTADAHCKHCLKVCGKLGDEVSTSAKINY